MKTISKSVTGMLAVALVSAMPFTSAVAAPSGDGSTSSSDDSSAVSSDVQVIDQGPYDRIEVYSPGDFEKTDSLMSVAGGGSCTAPAGAQVTCKDGTGYTVRKGPVSQMRLGYRWSVSWLSSSKANVIGRGFTYNKQTWHGGGASKSGSFTVPWYGVNGGEIMANKMVKVRSMNPPAGVQVNWS